MIKGKTQQIDLCMAIQSPMTDRLSEIASSQQVGARNDNHKKAQGHQPW